MDGVPLFARRGAAEAGTELPAPHGDPWADLRRQDGGWPDPSDDLREPRRHWRLEVGAGFAGFAVAGALAITQEQRGPYECVVAYDLRGREVWAYGDSARFVDLVAGVGPRSTPVVDGGRVYALGATGWLRCLAAVAPFYDLFQQTRLLHVFDGRDNVRATLFRHVLIDLAAAATDSFNSPPGYLQASLGPWGHARPRQTE